MKERGFWLPLSLAVMSALAYLFTLTTRERQVLGDLETIKILYASADLPERMRLEERFVQTRSIPRRYAPPDAFEVRVPSDLKMVSGLVTRVRVPKGGALVQSALTSYSPGSGLSVKVPPGYRAAVLPVERDLAALMKPGDRVDVVVTFEARMAQGDRQKVTATILQNLLVLSVGKDLGAAAGKADGGAADKSAAFSQTETVGVAVNPFEFQYLALAGETGRLGISLRSPGDIEIHPIQMASLAKLFGS